MGKKRNRQPGDLLAFGGDYRDEGRIFCRRDGALLIQRESSRRFPVLRERAGIPDAFRFHALRHTFATMHLSSGTPARDVQEALGHATIAQTMNVYSHVLPNMQRDAAARLDALL
jgi:integrase